MIIQHESRINKNKKDKTLDLKFDYQTENRIQIVK